MDELWSGVAVVAAPAVEAEHAVSHRAYALTVFVAPLLLASVLEAGLALVSDRVPRRRLVAGALFALGASLALCASARSAVSLSLGLACAGTSSGVACAAAQAELVRGDPARAERSLTRWVFFGSLGDILTPLLVAAVFALGGTYRAAFWAIALTTTVQALALSRARAPGADHTADVAARNAEGTSDAEDAPALPIAEALRAAASNRSLWLWLAGCAACTLLDELVVGLASLRMRADLGFSQVTTAICVTALSLGGAFGAATTEGLLARTSSTRLLIASSLISLVALGAAIHAHSVLSLLPALFCLGVGETPQYGLLKARAYATFPGHPGVVNALAQLFVALDVAAPFVLGTLADRFGLAVALAALAAQPLTVLALSLFARHSSRKDV